MATRMEVDVEEILRRKFRARCLFRALGRMVMANAYWLMEDGDHYVGLEDVKRRVELAVRGKAKKKHLLSINDKVLLNIPAEERTEKQKKYLYRIIGGLKCFRRYPNQVKRKLAAVTYFKYYGPGRTIVRQHHEAHALYFIVTGDVVVSQLSYDGLLQQYFSVDVGVMHPGDMFGEVSLLHNIPRTATVTTAGHCELLVLMKEDFKNVLHDCVQKQWDEVRRAMSAFSYFDTLDEVSRREACIVAKMKSFKPKETILGDGVGVPNFVYFILSGRCQMIESLKVIVKTHLGRSYYSLYDPYLSNDEDEEEIESKLFKSLRIKKECHLSEVVSSSKCGEINIEELEKNVSEDRMKGRPSVLKQEKNNLQTESLHVALCVDEETDEAALGASEGFLLSSVDLLKPTEIDFRESMRISVPYALPRGPLGRLRTYFMQVCRFNAGSSFGFGEKMRDRRIVALTPVSCLLLPKVWLLQRNTANIWSRIEHYLEKKILTKKQLFDAFVTTMHWGEYRDKLVADIVGRSKTVNATSVHDVPYSIRMEEIVDV